VLGFWATWCAHCRAEFPSLETVYSRYRNNPRVVLVAIDTMEADTARVLVPRIRQYLADARTTFPVLLDEGSVVSNRFDVQGLPTQVLIDRDGMVRNRRSGFPGDRALVEELTAMIDALLKER
jgi:thiol-disulfide isomerase/thioredoxin